MEDGAHDLLLHIRDNEIHHRGQRYVHLLSVGIEPRLFGKCS